MITRRLLLGATAATAVLARTSSEIRAQEAKEYAIGLAGPITGANASYGALIVNGAKLAIEKLRSETAASGPRFSLLLGDDQMDPKQSPLVAQRLAQNSRVVAVIGHFASTNSLAALPVYNRVGVPLLSHSTSQTLGGKWFFRLANTNEAQAAIIVSFATQRLKVKTVYVLYEQSEGAQNFQKLFLPELEKRGVRVLEISTHQPSDKDFSADITKLMSIKPDLVILNTFFVQASLFLRQAAAAGYKGVYIGNDAIGSPELIALAGDAATGVYAPATWNPASNATPVKEFVEAYKKAYNTEPEQYGAQAHAAVMIIADAIRNGATTRSALRTYLEENGQKTGYDTAAGLIKWDRDHNPNTPLVMLQSDGKRFAPVIH